MSNAADADRRRGARRRTLQHRVLVGPERGAARRALDERPEIQYATRPTTDRVARLNEQVRSGRSARPRYNALAICARSSTRWVYRSNRSCWSSPRPACSAPTPTRTIRARSTTISRSPSAMRPARRSSRSRRTMRGKVWCSTRSTRPPRRRSIVRRTSCLTCHVSPGTLGVPGLIARSHVVGEDGNVLPQTSAHDVDHHTSHPDRWGGWFVTVRRRAAAVPAARASGQHHASRARGTRRIRCSSTG